MSMKLPLRRLVLTLHVVSSVGWWGAVIAFLAMAVTGIAAGERGSPQAVYVAMGPVYLFGIVPMGLASLGSGIIASLGTRWGLVRHYWLLVKLIATVPAVGLMLFHAQLVSRVSALTAAGEFRSPAASPVKVQLLVYALATALILVVMTAISIYKPRGQTSWRRLDRVKPASVAR